MNIKLSASFVLFALACAPLYGETILYYRFEEGSSNSITDDAGLFTAYLDASSTDAGAGDTGAGGWSTNVPNAIIPLTGVTNRGSIHYPGAEVLIHQESPGIEMGTSFTIEFYFKLDYAYGGSFFALRPIYFACSESLGDRYVNGQFFDQLPYHIATNIVLDQWYHLALVKEPGKYTVFLNGIHHFTDSLPTSTDGPYTSYDHYRYPRTIGGTFYGWIDEFRISSEALTPDQFLSSPWMPVINSIAHKSGGTELTISNVLLGITTTVEHAYSMSEPLTWHTSATLAIDGAVTNWIAPMQDDSEIYFRVLREE